MLKLLAAFVPVILCNVDARGQQINTGRLDSFFNALARHDLAMGSVAISVNGVMQYQRPIGSIYLDQTRKIPADIYAKYRIGSISKMFTAVMIFQLIEEKKINLNQTLNLYFPNLPNAERITIRQMLYHRSGLSDYTEGTNFPQWMDSSKSHDELIRMIVEKKSDFEPDSMSRYSNSNYLLLSYIIEKACKMSYAQALNRQIIARIDLENTYYGKPIDIYCTNGEVYAKNDILKNILLICFNKAADIPLFESLNLGFINKCRSVDRSIAALILDLKQRGMLDETLVIWGAEFGRTPMMESRNLITNMFRGRDHHTEAFTIWMAGGGLKKGYSYGETDEIGYYPVSGKVELFDIQATILNQLGFDHETFTFPFQGRPFRLTDVSGKVITDIIA